MARNFLVPLYALLAFFVLVAPGSPVPAAEWSYLDVASGALSTLLTVAWIALLPKLNIPTRPRLYLQWGFAFIAISFMRDLAQEVVTYGRIRTWMDVLETLQPIGLAFATGGVVTWVASEQETRARLMASREAYRRESNLDALTGLGNRRAFERLAPEPLAGRCLLVLDLDNFKKFNDTFGHAAGDELLRAFGSLLQKTLREDDRAFRIGGEEFLVLLATPSLEQATAVAQRLGDALRKVPIEQVARGEAAPTTSIGAAGPIPRPETVHEAFQRADAACYAAKHGGKDRTVVAGDTPRAQLGESQVGIKFDG